MALMWWIPSSLSMCTYSYPKSEDVCSSPDNRPMPITVVGLDGDDTLWHNETRFILTQGELRDLLHRHVGLRDVAVQEVSELALSEDEAGLVVPQRVIAVEPHDCDRHGPIIRGGTNVLAFWVGIGAHGQARRNPPHQRHHGGRHPEPPLLP